jgi:hypothetical protein
MRNLAGIKEADEYIREELFLAGIMFIQEECSKGEVPYSIIGKLGDWTFSRAWYYWVASAPEGKGLPLDLATKLHEKAYLKIGENQPETYGQVIRVAGHCGCPPPKKWAKHYDSLDRLLVHDPKGEEEKLLKHILEKGVISEEQIKKYYFVNTLKELKRKAAKSVIDLYHIDTQLGLDELTHVIRMTL